VAPQYTTHSVECGSCGRDLGQLTLNFVDSEPCADCGSTVRRFDANEPQQTGGMIGPIIVQIQNTYWERSLPWLLAVAATTILSGLVGGLLLHGWLSAVVSLALSTASFYLGLKALTRVRANRHLFP
jgi:hypothetical protein